MTFQKIGILGLGLIGGSFAGLIRRNHPEAAIFGFDLDTQAIELALKKRWLNAGTTNLTELPKDLDLAIVCVPIAQVVEMIEAISAHVSSELVITDVASIKHAIAAHPKQLCENHVYIGGHPMAGSEQSGISFATDHLLEKATYILIPSPHPKFNALNSWLRELSFHLLEMSSEDHDHWVAYASHIPYLMAALTVKTTENIPISPFNAIISTGFRDTTRVSAKDPRWGRDVCLYNTDQILPILTDVSKVLQELCELLREKNPEKIQIFFSEIQEIRKKYYD